MFLNSFPEYHKGTSYGRQVGSLRSALCAPFGRGDENSEHSYRLLIANIWFLNSFPEGGRKHIIHIPCVASSKRVFKLIPRRGTKTNSLIGFIYLDSKNPFLNSFPEGGRKLSSPVLDAATFYAGLFLNSFPEYHKGTSYGRQVGSLRSGGRKRSL